MESRWHRLSGASLAPPSRAVAGLRVVETRLRRACSRLRLAVEARRNDVSDTLEAGEHNRALARTGRGAPELDLKRPEQSLKLRQRAVPQLATGDDLCHRTSPV